MKAANIRAAPRTRFSWGGQQCFLFYDGGTRISIFPLQNVLYGTVRLLHPHRQITYEDIFQVATGDSPLSFTTVTQLMVRSNDEGREFGYHGQGVLWGPIPILSTLQVGLQKRQRLWTQQCGHDFCCSTFKHNSRARGVITPISKGVKWKESDYMARGYPVCTILLDNTPSPMFVYIQGVVRIKGDHILRHLDMISMHPQAAMAWVSIMGFEGNNAPNGVRSGCFTCRKMLCAVGATALQWNTPHTIPRVHDVHIFDLCPNKRLRKQSWGWWFETLPRSLCRHCNEHTNFRHHIYRFAIIQPQITQQKKITQQAKNRIKHMILCMMYTYYICMCWLSIKSTTAGFRQ